MSTHDEIRELKRRLANLEAAACLREMLQPSTDEEILSSLCQQIRLGIAQVQSSSRAPAVVRGRSFLATNLHRRLGWTQARIATAMRKEERAIRKMIARAC